MKMTIKKLLLLCFLALAAFTSVMGQQRTQKEYLDRYNLLVSKLGTTGVGIETLLDNWEKDYPDDIEMLSGKFIYYFSKSQSNSVEKMDRTKYLGQDPILTLKDSLGTPVNYFQVTNYDDELFGKAVSCIDKAIQLNPDRLDFRQARISALTAYEGESPDMATSSLKALIDYNASQRPKWEYPGASVDQNFFDGVIQEFCYTFFRYASPACQQAFKDISEKMVSYYPKDVLFLDNLGSYYLVVARDDKTAMKYYNKVLKLNPGDVTAIKNTVILARNSKNVKLEKKYLPLLIKYSDSESEKVAAERRLDSLNGK